MLAKTNLARLLATLAILLLLLGPFSTAAESRWLGPATAATLPLLRAAPTLSIIPIGEIGEVDIRVEQVQNLFGFETLIQFNPTRIHVQDADLSASGVQIEAGPFLKPDNPSQWYVINSVDNEAGRIHLAITRIAPLEGVSGSGVLATIRFRTVTRGHSPLAFSPTATLMLSPAVMPMPFNVKSAGVLIGPVQRLRLPLTLR